MLENTAVSATKGGPKPKIQPKIRGLKPRIQCQNPKTKKQLKMLQNTTVSAIKRRPKGIQKPKIEQKPSKIQYATCDIQ